jgi:hypothetical protein
MVVLVPTHFQSCMVGFIELYILRFWKIENKFKSMKNLGKV